MTETRYDKALPAGQRLVFETIGNRRRAGEDEWYMQADGQVLWWGCGKSAAKYNILRLIEAPEYPMPAPLMEFVAADEGPTQNLIAGEWYECVEAGKGRLVGEREKFFGSRYKHPALWQRLVPKGERHEQRPTS